MVGVCQLLTLHRNKWRARCDDLLDNLVGQGKQLITVKPSTFALLALITNSNFAGCMTGKSAGFSPLRILPAA